MADNNFLENICALFIIYVNVMIEYFQRDSKITFLYALNIVCVDIFMILLFTSLTLYTLSIVIYLVGTQIVL